MSGSWHFQLYGLKYQKNIKQNVIVDNQYKVYVDAPARLGGKQRRKVEKRKKDDDDDLVPKKLMGDWKSANQMIFDD